MLEVMSKEDKLYEALWLKLSDGEMPTDEQLRHTSKMWKEALDSPYRLEADKDFLAGAIWGIQLVTGNLKP